MQNKAGIAGILSIISGIFGVLWLVYAYFMTYWFNFMSKFADMHEFPSVSVNIVQLMSIIYIIVGSVVAAIGIFAIVAGIFTLKRKHWGLALAGAIAGTITFFPCGIPAIILISSAQNEFLPNQKSTAPKSAS